MTPIANEHIDTTRDLHSRLSLHSHFWTIQITDPLPMSISSSLSLLPLHVETFRTGC